ncbi:hypothetical protein [Neptunicella sp.]|uniref:hypothetical protein n=1 Tax=Neptunicella sp. TaxID=2125986 RepID=UPI003F68ED3C
MRITIKLLVSTMFLMWTSNVLALSEPQASIPPEEKQYIVTENLKYITELLASTQIQQCLVDHQSHLLSLVDILKIDQKWPSQDKPLLQVLKHPCAKLFEAKLNEPHNQFSEFMLTDELGALIAATPIPSDYWQADEQKFIQPAVTGKNYISEEGWDASTGTFSFLLVSRCNMTINLLGS